MITVDSIIGHRRELDGMLGMCEMECAVEVMLQKSERKGTPFEYLILYIPHDFTGDALVGFCQLAARGMVAPGYPNCYFRPTQALIDRLRKQNPKWAGIGDEPPFEVWYERRALKPNEWTK